MKRSLSLIVFLILCSALIRAQEKKIIYLSWDNVVDQSLSSNLSLKSTMLDYEAQNLEVWKGISSFLPTFSYQGLAVKNIELPVFVFQGQKFAVGTNYTFQHSLNLTLPLFTGGSRWFSLSARKSIKKSLGEELKGKKEEVVLSGLEAYYGIILAQSLLETAEEGARVANRNLEQVKKQYDAGTATELDLQRAKAQYSAALPRLESARSNLRLSKGQLKSWLNLPLNDSLVVLDSLSKKSFLISELDLNLPGLKKVAYENRNDLKSIKYQLDATEEGENLALATFAPVISVSASVDHQAPVNDIHVQWNDYIRSKSLTLSVNWPIFEGGSKILEYQKAKIRTDQMQIAVKQVKDQAELNVEQSFFKYNEAVKNLESLKEALGQSKESMRISNLLYEQGMSTQLDVLNAQLLYISSKNEYLQGIYNYNVSQLSLLKSIGKLNIIWN